MGLIRKNLAKKTDAKKAASRRLQGVVSTAGITIDPRLGYSGPGMGEKNTQQKALIEKKSARPLGVSPS